MLSASALLKASSLFFSGAVAVAVVQMPPSVQAVPEKQQATAQGSTAAVKSSAKPAPVKTDKGQLKLSDTLIMRMAGNAEGNLNPNGSKNPNYFSHTDPGDNHSNLGACSESNARNGTNLGSPEEADAYCLQKLQNNTPTVQGKASELGIELSLEELLNSLDLINQAPATVLDNPGFLDRLIEAKKRGLSGLDAVIDARVEAFSPDLGPIESRHYLTTFISKKWLIIDQTRRAKAIQNAMRAVAGEQGVISPVSFDPNRFMAVLRGANKEYVSKVRRLR